MRYADVAIPRPLPGTLSYAVPPEMEDAIKCGQRVLVPFRRQYSVGYIMEIRQGAPKNIDIKKIKTIKEILDLTPALSKEMQKFLLWMSSYYCAPIGEVCRAALPNRLNRHTAPKTTRPLSPPEMETPPRNLPEITLNPEQKRALEAVKEKLTSGDNKPILLHGITGSGKTEIYLRAFEELKKLGGQGLLLVPEISLTPQLVQTFTAKFKDEIAVYHSGLTDAQRQKQWENMRQSKVFAAIGTRSALFAPFPQLKLIIVDEEHDSSYKQEEGFLYQARDAAVMRAKLEGAVIILGSATPSFESFSNAHLGKYDYFELTRRATGALLPRVEIVDMRTQKRQKSGGDASLALSDTLIESIRETLEKKEQALIFLNRRGFSNFLLCPDCGHVLLCPNCDISLTHHMAPKRLLCHYCDFAFPIPNTCPKCGSTKLTAVGCGTERIEEELAKLFPQASIMRLDRDTQLKATSRKTFLSKMQAGKIDILVGTQIVAKGHDFPSVTLVGVVDADVSLHLPDFRSFERTFQILTQVAGRAGRADKPGRVIIQTYQPDHPSLVCAREHDFKSFFEFEKNHRQALKYPPFGRLANIRFAGNSNEKTRVCAKRCLSILTRQKKLLGLDKSIDLLGPAPAPLQKVRNKFRWHLLIKSPRSGQLTRFLNISMPAIGNEAAGGCRITIDVDPINML
jgi:primosomal protein N' (replication factor Y)